MKSFNLNVEYLKLKRTHTFLTISLLFIFFVLWGGMLVASYFNKLNQKNIELLLYIFTQVNSFFIPVAIAVFCSKIVSVELKGKAVQNLMTNGRSMQQIFRDKLGLSIIFFAMIDLLEILIILGISPQLSVIINYQELFVQFLGILLASVTLSLVQIFIAFRFAQPVVSIAVGVIGAFVGVIFTRLPFGLEAVLPWGMIDFLKPVSYVLCNGQPHYIRSSDSVVKFAAALFITLIYCVLFRKLMTKSQTRSGKGKHE